MTARVLFRRGRTLGADSSGNLLVEFALALPVLLLLLVGLLDLGRFALQKSAMYQGARAGAQYGIMAFADTTNINATAQSATGLTGVTATSTVFCECVSGTAVVCSTTCGSGQLLKRFIRVDLTKSFSTVLSSSALTLGGIGTWTPPTTVTASVTMIVP